MEVEIHNNPVGSQVATDPAGKVPWSPLIGVVYAVVIFVAAQLLAGVLVAMYPHLRGWSKSVGQDWATNSVVAQFWFVLMAEAMTVAATWWFIVIRGARVSVIGLVKPRKWDVVLGINGVAVYFILYIVAVGVIQHFIPALNVNQKQDLGFNNVTGTTDLALTFLSLVVLPPLAEEIVFRGLIFTGLRNKLHWVWAAVITSALFCVPHLLESGGSGGLLWIAGIDTFILSLVLCYLRQKSNSLWPGIIVHALKNTIAFIELYNVVNLIHW